LTSPKFLSIGLHYTSPFLLTCRLSHMSVCLSVCLSARKVYCGKTADWIRVPLGVVSGVVRVMGELDEVHVTQKEGDALRNGECDALFPNYIGRTC